MTDHNKNDDYLTIGEAAQLAGYSADYFRRCVCQGKPLGGLKPPPVVTAGVHKYIRRGVMERWLVRRELPQVDDLVVIINDGSKTTQGAKPSRSNSNLSNFCKSLSESLAQTSGPDGGKMAQWLFSLDYDGVVEKQA